MKRILLLSIPLAFLAACGPVPKKGCKETGCGAGSVCNTNTGSCEVLGAGGGGGSMGGGGGATGGGTGGGATGGGSTDGGADAGMMVIDPFDDGGVFVPGDICSNAIPVLFVAADGGPSSVVTLGVDLATATSQYKAVCNRSTGDGNDVLFAITLTEPRGLVVRTNDTSNKMQDAVLALISSPCPLLTQAACIDAASAGLEEVLIVERLAAGTWFVLLENFAATNTDDGTYEVTFELVDPVAGPANDGCSTARALTFTNATTTVIGTTAGAFNDTGASALSCSQGSALAAEVFYSFTLAQPQNVTVTVNSTATSNLIPAFAITNRCGLAGVGNERGCATGAGSTFVARNLPAGTYFIVVDGDGPTTGAFTLQVTLTPATPAPANDTCAMPAQLVANVSQMVDVNSANGDYNACGVATGGDVVYQFTTTAAQQVTITATGMNNADGVISLRAAPCDNDTGEVSCVDVEVMNPEVLNVRNLPAGTYYVVLAAYRPAAGQFLVQLAIDPPVLPPSNETCALAEVVTLNAGTASRLIDLTGVAADIASDLCATTADGADVVYEIAIPAMQTLTVVATPIGAFSTLDPMLFARQPVCAGPVSIACSNTGLAGDPETLVIPNITVGPLTVYVVVKAFDILDPGELNITFTAM